MTKQARLVACGALLGVLFTDTTVLLAGQMGSAVALGALDSPNTEESGLRRQLEAARDKSNALTLRVTARGRRYVRLVRAGLLPLGSGLEALIDHAAKVERLRNAIKTDLEALGALQRHRIEISAQLKAAKARRAELDAQWGSLSKARDAILSADERARAFEQAFLNGGGTDHTAVYSPSLGPTDASATYLSQGQGGFARLRGRLPFPLPGRTEIRPTDADAPHGHALSMLGRPGAAVRAVSAGRVAFADEYPEYGQTVILDHGDDFFTVSANLGSLDVRAGDEVAAGSRIATLGGDGTLHFEVRKNMDALDPAEWFGI